MFGLGMLFGAQLVLFLQVAVFFGWKAIRKARQQNGWPLEMPEGSSLLAPPPPLPSQGEGPVISEVNWSVRPGRYPGQMS